MPHSASFNNTLQRTNVESVRRNAKAPGLSPGAFEETLWLEVQLERELDLTIRAQSHALFNRAGEQSERRPSGGLRVWLTRLNGQRARGGTRCLSQRRAWQGEVRHVEKVEELRAEVQARPFGNAKSLAQDQVELPRIGAAKRVTGKIAECARPWNCKRCGVQKISVVVQIGIHARNQIGPTGGTARPSAGRVDHGCTAGGG